MSAVDRRSGYLDPKLETMDAQARRESQDKAVADIVAHAYANASAFTQRMKKAGLEPGDIQSVKDLEKLPVVEKAELVELQQKNLPFGGLNGEPIEQMRRIYISPGPIYEPGENNFDDNRWAQAFYAAGFRSGDICQVTFNFSMVPFAFWLDECLHMIGCKSVPTGVGNTELQVQTMKDLQVTGYLGTPSFLAAVAEKAEAMGIDTRKDLNLQAGFVAAEMLPETLRADLEDRFGMIIRQSYGTADVGCLSYECSEMSGMHYAQNCVVEIVDPDTGKQLGPGEPGEVVATVFNTAYPLIRFGTGDLSAYEEGTCACGRTDAKLTRIMGRVDQVTKVKGMFVHPGNVKQVVDQYPEVAAYQLVVDRDGHKDVMTLVCEVDDISAGGLSSRMEVTMKDVLRVSGGVELVEKGRLPEGCKIIEDRRKWD